MLEWTKKWNNLKIKEWIKIVVFIKPLWSSLGLFNSWVSVEVIHHNCSRGMVKDRVFKTILIFTTTICIY